MDFMIPNDVSWDKIHHHSSLPYSIEYNLSDMYLPNFVRYFMSSISIHELK